MNTKNSIFTFVISGILVITSEKLIGSDKYISWSAFVELWFMGQGYEDYLIKNDDDVSIVDEAKWKKIDAQLCSILWQSGDSNILHHLRAYKYCLKFWSQAQTLYTNDIQRFYKVFSEIVHVKQQNVDLPSYIGKTASLKEDFCHWSLLLLVPKISITTDKLFRALTFIGFPSDLDPVRDQILVGSSVPSLDEVFACFLRVSSTQFLMRGLLSHQSWPLR